MTAISASFRHSKLQLVVSLVATFLPQRAKHFLYRRVLGWDVDATAKIGFSLLLAPSMRIGEGVVIGNFNIVNGDGEVVFEPHCWVFMFNLLAGCEEIRIGHHAGIGFWNSISGPSLSRGVYPASPERRPVFDLGPHAVLVRSHRVDCSDAVHIGPYVVLAGVQTLLMTHTIDLVDNVMRTYPIEIGEYCHLGTRVTVQAGTKIAPRTAVAPGAVVHGDTGKPDQLIGGVPAKPIKDITGAKSFTRSVGPIF